MRGLPLRELILLDCSPSTFSQLSSLFVDSALPGLQKLHVEDIRVSASSFEDDVIFPTDSDEDLPEEDLKWIQEVAELEAFPHRETLKTVGKAIMSLPQLYQISGCSSLFDLGMQHGLSSWHESREIDVHLIDFHTSNMPRGRRSFLRSWSKG